MKLYWLSLISFGLFTNPVLADDTEIYLGNPNRVNPNVVFIFDTSGSMGWDTDSGETRISLVKKAAVETIKETGGINLALMRFNPYIKTYECEEEDSNDYCYQGGRMSINTLDIDATGSRQQLIDIINNYPAGGGTPMSESLYEAALYLRGESVKFGKAKLWSNRWDRWYTEYLSDSATYNASTGKYISPITDSCQKNHIVVFTDGAASQDSEANYDIKTWLKTLPSADYPRGISPYCSRDGGCSEELAYFLYNADHSPLPGTQQIHVHTIGGFIEGDAQTRLNVMANVGGGISANAKNYEQLKTALTKIFDDISKSADTFSAPAVAVNAFNSLELLDQLYFSVFKPNASVNWQGNIKRFRLAGDGQFVDVKNNPALDATTGFFTKNAQSFWTKDEDAPDGDNVTKGGAASRLTLDRMVVSNIASNRLASDSRNRITESNASNLSQSLFKVSYSSEQFSDLLKWARGLDVKGEDPSAPRRAMEDPLHSKPVILNYGSLKDADGDVIPDSTLFIGTNSGYLHAFDTNVDNPKERFAFIPKDLLPNVAKYYEGGGSKIYGLDGPISAYHTDTNRNRIIDAGRGEKAYLYVGMRRGGRNYYALDVTDRDAPQLAWQITGGSGDYAQLGQSWSKMQAIPVLWNGTPRNVLLFGGGYDPAEDTNVERLAHNQGNAIYMADPTTGKRLWWASAKSGADLRLSDMTSGIVGDIIPIDNNRDGYVDLLYAADLGGRIWRIDLMNLGSSTEVNTQGGVLADLGANNTTLNHVRFYTTPDVTYMNRVLQIGEDSLTGEPVYEKVPRYQIAIGSGYRAHPLDQDTVDRFYVINDLSTEASPPAQYNTSYLRDLANYSRYDSESFDKKLKGLYFTLPDSGEKIVATAVTSNGRTYFSSYRPNNGSTSGCNADTGFGRLYMLTTPENQETTIPGQPQPSTPKPTIDIIDEIDNPMNDPKIIIVPPEDDEDEDDKKKCGEIITDGSSVISICEEGGRIVHKTYWRDLSK
ncbi:PilC/PilY family type IV pilus protein [Thalassolituus hydrocarboniclasticus]|uniref:VWFA domain-containing protein n=1 Tax=Thalassolituus hydrocarboniclasticus TaxID=2742796 RepID=A0ABY6A7N5_9GAMM|nr:PilC/PilY family type IV pilus protein [Thalassolituus hydrocarboniclasticus]UXD86652.1 hypothetical protein HUF19_03975 [Thalassolituus hydrocarboniclasticus]